MVKRWWLIIVINHHHRRPWGDSPAAVTVQRAGFFNDRHERATCRS